MPGKKFYGVHHREHGAVFTEWAAAEQHMQRSGKCKVKKFTTEREAGYFARWGCAPPDPSNGALDPHSVAVYTDGSCRMNLAGEKAAGIGVYFGPGHPCNISAPFVELPLTNNRAELTAILRAVECASNPANYTHLGTPAEKSRLVIYTDSSYARDALGKWREAWTRTDFRDGTILNRDIVEQAWQALDMCPREVVIVWKKGHCGIAGNEMADALANAGALVNQTQ